MNIHSVYDLGPETFDRYSVYYKGRGTLCHTHAGTLREYVGMSADPCHPQGFGQHGLGKPGRHNGKRITFASLPAPCRALVERDLGL